jgi:hypothetical protein
MVAEKDATPKQFIGSSVDALRLFFLKESRSADRDRSQYDSSRFDCHLRNLESVKRRRSECKHSMIGQENYSGRFAVLMNVSSEFGTNVLSKWKAWINVGDQHRVATDHHDLVWKQTSPRQQFRRR